MADLSVVGMIPARYASTRLPGKVLLDLAGKPMIQRVHERCLSKKQRYSLRKGWELLNQAFDVRMEAITDPRAALDEFDAFVDMHRAQWAEQGRPG